MDKMPSQPPTSQTHAFERSERIRYARHFVLPEVGEDGQRRLKEARVLLVGAGGLGSPAAMYLAAAGVGSLGIIDHDIVDASNLQRQILHSTSDVGRAKVDSAVQRLGELNPHISVVPYAERLTAENALELLEPWDVIIDGSDNFPTRYLVNDACVLLGRPDVYGAVSQWEGQVAVFGAEGGPCYRCLFREPPPPGLVTNCAEGGVLGVLPGIVGSLQALEALKLVLGVGRTLAGRLLLFDAMECRFREIELRRNPDCPVCGDQPTQTSLIDYDLFCGVKDPVASTDSGVDQIGPREAAQQLQRSGADRPFLLDVRELGEWAVGNLAELGAQHIPLGQLGERSNELPRDRDILVYCRMGGRGLDACRQLHAAGFSRVVNLDGGLLRWAETIDSEIAVP